MGLYLNENFKLDISYYDHEIVFDEYMAAVENKYSNIIKPRNAKVGIILRIQCAIEIISTILDQIEELTKETFKISFTLATIKNAIDIINKDLLLVFQEVKDFFKSMKQVEKFNRRTFDLVRELKKEVGNFRRINYLIPQFEKEVLEDNIKREIPLLRQYLQTEKIDADMNLLKELTSNSLLGTSVLQILKLNDIFQFFNRLRSLHCEFSFLLLHIYFKDDCPKSLLKLSNSKEVPTSYLEDLFNRFVELAQLVFVKGNACRKNYCRIHSMRKRLIDNYRKKQELQIQQLNNLQIILRIISELNEKHDNLSGKLIKTTELFAKVHELLERPWRDVKNDAALHVGDKFQGINNVPQIYPKNRQNMFQMSSLLSSLTDHH